MVSSSSKSAQGSVPVLIYLLFFRISFSLKKPKKALKLENTEKNKIENKDDSTVITMGKQSLSN